MNKSNQEEEEEREKFVAEGWISALQKEDIEDIIENVNYQINKPSENDYLKAFKFYLENDAFNNF